MSLNPLASVETKGKILFFVCAFGVAAIAAAMAWGFWGMDLITALIVSAGGLVIGMIIGIFVKKASVKRSCDAHPCCVWDPRTVTDAAGNTTKINYYQDCNKNKLASNVPQPMPIAQLQPRPIPMPNQYHVHQQPQQVYP